jgi:hypothetical protein
MISEPNLSSTCALRSGIGVLKFDFIVYASTLCKINPEQINILLLAGYHVATIPIAHVAP